MKLVGALGVVVLVCALTGCAPTEQQPTSVRVATFNASLNRATEGQLAADLSGENAQARAVADVIAENAPDILLVNEFDYSSEAVELFRENYLDGVYPPSFTAPVNTGVDSGLDLDSDGSLGGPNDAYGFGVFPGQYGMLVLSRLPIAAATFSRLPSRRRRSFVQADLAVNGRTLRICSVHLESGQDGAWLRAWQLRRVFRAVSADQAVILGDFNLRDGEERWLSPAYRDVWPALHPRDPGFTENSWTNPMLRDSKKKPRQLRFDRVLIKGADWVPTDMAMLGTEPISPELPRVFPSDHFGLQCRLRSGDPGCVTER